MVCADSLEQSGNIERISELLPPLLSGASEIYTDIKTFDTSRSVLSRFLYGNSGGSEIQRIVEPRKVKPLRPILNELRVFKSDSEVVNMRLAGQASGRAFTESMRQHFNKEKDLSAFLQYQFKVQGCDGSAFVPVVAGGRVCVTLDKIDPVQLVLTYSECVEYTLHPKRRYPKVSVLTVGLGSAADVD